MYNINAPVDLDGGAGFDKLIVETATRNHHYPSRQMTKNFTKVLRVRRRFSSVAHALHVTTSTVSPSRGGVMGVTGTSRPRRSTTSRGWA